MLSGQESVSIQDSNAGTDQFQYQLMTDFPVSADAKRDVNGASTISTLTTTTTTSTTEKKPVKPSIPVAKPTINKIEPTAATIDKIIIKSTLDAKNSNDLAKHIAAEFNSRRRTSSLENSSVRGVRVEPGKFLLITRNNIPEVALSSESQVALPIATAPGINISVKGIFSFNETYVSAGGTHYINVPVGKIAKVISNNKPILLGAGPHIIHDATLVFDKNTGLVNMSDLYIKHGTLHIITVPAGKIAKAWIGGEPRLLEYQKEPYIFDSPFFSLETTSNNYFIDASAKNIIHGSIKRLIPETGEVAITYNNGLLEVIEPSKDGKPYIIDSGTHRFDSFLSSTVQTLIFPSQITKEQRRIDNKNATPDEISYEIFTTKDSLKVGVKLLVAYTIKDAYTAVSKLGTMKEIIRHIENIATVDMGKVIQQCTAMEFLASAQTKPKNQGTERKQDSNPSAPELLTFQDEVRDQLSKDLHEYGIELVRLNIETPKIIDAKIADEMAQQSLVTAKTSAREAVIETQTILARKEAQQKAEVEAIAQKQQNSNLVNAAQTKLAAAEIEAKATLTKAKAEADALLLKAKAEMEILQLRGKAYQEFPQLCELETTKLRGESLQKATMFVTPEELRVLFSPLNNMGIFNQRPAISLPAPNQILKQSDTVNKDAKLTS